MMKQVLIFIAVLFAGGAMWFSLEPTVPSAASGKGSGVVLSDRPETALDALRTAIVAAAASAEVAFDDAAQAMKTLLDASGCCGYQSS